MSNAGYCSKGQALYPADSGLEAEDAQDCLHDELGPDETKRLKPDFVTAQELYDIRMITGEISRNDLCGLFRRLIGDPSPRGCVEIERSAVMGDEEGRGLLLKGETPLKFLLNEIIDYVVRSRREKI